MSRPGHFRVHEAAQSLFFSPDGRWIGFWRAEDRILRKVSLAGGSPIEIAPTDVPHDAVWTANDEIVIQNGDPDGALWSIPASGGPARAIAVRDRSDGESISPRALVPGTRDLLVASTSAAGTFLDVLSRETGRRRRLLRGGSNLVARFTPTGHLVFSDADTLLAVPLNQRFEPVGDATPLLRGIDHYSNHANVALSDNGTVVYLPLERVREPELVWLDRRWQRHAGARRTGTIRIRRSLAERPGRGGRPRAARSRKSGSTTWFRARSGCSSPKARAGSRFGAGTVHPSLTSRPAEIDVGGSPDACGRHGRPGVPDGSRRMDRTRRLVARTASRSSSMNTRSAATRTSGSTRAARRLPSLLPPRARRLRGSLPMAASSPSTPTTVA